MNVERSPKKVIFHIVLVGDCPTGEMPTGFRVYDVRASDPMGMESDFAVAVRHAKTGPVLLVDYEPSCPEEVKVAKWHGPINIQFLSWAKVPLQPVQNLVVLLKRVCERAVEAYAREEDYEFLGVLK
jgi:hypothetical protein